MAAPSRQDVETMIEEALKVFEVRVDNEPIFRNDLTGQVLDPVLVKAARKKELDFFEASLVLLKFF